MLIVLHSGAGAMSDKFVADVGGTNIRLARVTDTGVTDIKKYMKLIFETLQKLFKRLNRVLNRCPH